MKPIERILAAVDFSELSNEVLKAAFYFAEKTKARVLALHVVSQALLQGHWLGSQGLQLVDEVEKKAERELEERVSASIGSGQEAASEVIVGVPYVDIIRFAKQQKVQFLIAGTHGGGVFRIFLGSVAEDLMRNSECPVWILRNRFEPPQKILLLTDLSEPARAGFRMGLVLAKLFNAKVHLLHVFDFPPLPSFTGLDLTEYELKMRESDREEFQKWVEEAKMAKVEVSQEWIEGKVTSTIEEAIGREKPDLLVMSTHGESGLFHKHLGSVTIHLARHAPCSLITVRPEGFRYKEI